MGMMLLDPDSEAVRQMVARLNHQTESVNCLKPLAWSELSDPLAGHGISVEGVSLFHPGGTRAARLVVAARLRATAEELETPEEEWTP